MVDDTTEHTAKPEIHAPLNEPAARVIPFAKILILEHGIRLTKVGADAWQYAGTNSLQTGAYADLVPKLGLAAVKAVIESGSRDHGFLLPAIAGQPVFEMQVQHLGECATRVDAGFSQQARHISYIAEATAYHCDQLIERYLDALETAIRDGQNRDKLSEDFIFGGSVAHYFEFEALITTLIRAYDTARFALWRAYGDSGSTPSNFARVASHISAPKPLATVCTMALGTYREAKRYRDCIQHYAHFGARLPFARIQLREGMVWSVLALLPDNPEVKSYEEFSYERQIDALSYGWRLTDRLLGDLKAIIEGLPSAQ